MTHTFRWAGERTVWALLRTEQWDVVSVRGWLGSFQRQYLLRQREDEAMTQMDPQWVPQQANELPVFAVELDAVMALLADPAVRAAMQRELLELATVKGVVYARGGGVDSCLTRAWGGLHHNLMRKFDRIDAVGKRWGLDAQPSAVDLALAHEAALDGDAETLYVTLRDAAVYLVHAMRYVQAQIDAAKAQPLQHKVLSES